MSELPPRRMNRTGVFVWEQLRLIVTAGFDSELVAREVFARPHRTDRALDSTLDDLCMLVSFKLQDDGLTAAEPRARLNPPPPPGSPSARSLAGTLLDAVIELEAELAEEWRRGVEAAAGRSSGAKYGANVHAIPRRDSVSRGRGDAGAQPPTPAVPPPAPL